MVAAHSDKYLSQVLGTTEINVSPETTFEEKQMRDRQITISTGTSRKDLNWIQTPMTVSGLFNRLKTPVRGAETLQAYTRMSKTQQDALKDVGGFVGGPMSGPRRKAGSVTGRDVITLDFDSIPAWQTDAVLQATARMNCVYCIYSTRKHAPSAPRLRVLIPLDRTVSPDEYEPIARRVASCIGIAMADPTTFEVSRLMYWPSCCSDSEFVYRAETDPELLSADFILGTYADWHDVKSWPVVPGKEVNYTRLAVKQGDPLTKAGIVGAFCRTYDIRQAMDTFLPGIYAPVETDENRFTYLGGSTAGGAVLYDDGKFLYSHHATDPCGGHLVNAFDMVRLHKFGDLDDATDPETPVIRMPSYTKMCELASEDKQVRLTLARDRQEQARADFEGIGADGDDESDNNAAPEPDDAWKADLDYTKNGALKNTIDNAVIILEHDPALQGCFAMNLFAGRGEVLARLPWETEPFKRRRLWSDTDSNSLYWYMERVYGHTGKANIDSALDVHASEHAFNDVQDYINGLIWDGVPRLDTLFIDYLGAEDTQYNRTVCRMAFTAAIARAMDPGCKYDSMVILCGKQGIGKSTLLDKMSRGWFNDSIRSFEGKDASELLQGVWLVEISELDAFRKTDVARIKQFLSLRADRYRAAYGRHVRELPRCCVFFGTTNTSDFLQDTTGNRRFLPVDVGKTEHALTVWEDLPDSTINQIWAEAKMRWMMGEQLHLTGKMEKEAVKKQEEHRETSVREGPIIEFVNQKVPSNWREWPIDRRRDYWAGAFQSGDFEFELVERDRICAAEVWCELLGGRLKDARYSDTREINATLEKMPGWEPKTTRFGPYNAQRGFVKIG